MSAQTSINLAEFPTAGTPLFEPYWPDRMHRFVWRNWSLVAIERLAEVLGTDTAKVAAIAASMGLTEHQDISLDQWRRSYLTIIRRNWHVLSYEQLMQLLDWDEQQLAETLKEDDFLWIKMGSQKPECDTLSYTTPTAATARRAAEMRQVIAEHYPEPESLRYEPRFKFIERLSSAPTYQPLTTSVPATESELRIDSDWGIDFGTGAGAVARSAAARFLDFLSASFGIHPSDARTSVIRLSVDAQQFERPESHRITVSSAAVDIVARDDEGLLRALQYLQQQMQERGAPLLNMGVQQRDTQFWPRYVYSYFALYGDPLMEPQVDPYPDGYLERLSQMGVNGVWIQALLRQLAPSKDFAEFGQGSETRLANLGKLVARARNYGIGVWLYFNEPRNMPAAFFEHRPDIAGVSSSHGRGTAMCTSSEPVKRFLRDGTAHIFTQVPDLAGVFTISRSENLTNCYSHGLGDQCPRCAPRGAATVIAEVQQLIDEGARQGNPRARVIAWDWGWSDDMAADTIGQLPASVKLMSVSEWDMPITRGGVESKIGEYCVSVVPPGPRATRNWQSARQHNLKTIAKVAFNNSWECAATPHMLTTDTTARHCRNLLDADIKGLMLGWTLGGCPSPCLEVASRFYWNAGETPDGALTKVATSRYGHAGAEQGRAAWRSVAEALSEYPYSIGVVYHAPVQVGSANPLYHEPTGGVATMLGFAYDDIKGWCGPYPPKVFAAQMAKTADGLGRCVTALDAIARQATDQYQQAADEDRDLVQVLQTTFASVANQVHFVLARDALSNTSQTAEAQALLERLEVLIRDELQLAKQLHALCSAHSNVGFEASNHYFYVPGDLLEKVINCQWLLDSWLPAKRSSAS